MASDLVPCGHPPDPVAEVLSDGWRCHCGWAGLDWREAVTDGKAEGAPGPIVPCRQCGCYVACPIRRREPEQTKAIRCEWCGGCRCERCMKASPAQWPHACGPCVCTALPASKTEELADRDSRLKPPCVECGASHHDHRAGDQRCPNTTADDPAQWDTTTYRPAVEVRIDNWAETKVLLQMDVIRKVAIWCHTDVPAQHEQAVRDAYDKLEEHCLGI